MRFRFIVAATTVVALAGCASSGSGDEASASDITSIAPTAAIQQTIPDCWDYATTGWVESLSARPDGAAAVDLSEAYVSYMAWFRELIYSGATTIDATGSWGKGVELLRRYGWMSETDFLGTAAPAQYAVRHSEALAIVQTELATGSLATDAQRADRANVIAVLNRAWGVPPDVAALLQNVLGATYDHALADTTSLAGTKLHRLDEITAGYDGATPVTIADLVGLPADTVNFFNGKRIGATDAKAKYVFSVVTPPSDPTAMHAYLASATATLEQDIPIVMSLLQDDSLDDASGTYQKPASNTLTAHAYGHAVTIFDLSVQTSAFGLIPAGTPETRPDALAATLADDAKVLSFRARNTYWGTYQPGTKIAFAGGEAGTNDYSLDYLEMPVVWSGQNMTVLERLTLPNASFQLSKSPARP